jgi:hypothetical protein
MKRLAERRIDEFQLQDTRSGGWSLDSRHGKRA